MKLAQSFLILFLLIACAGSCVLHVIQLRVIHIQHKYIEQLEQLNEDENCWQTEAAPGVTT